MIFSAILKKQKKPNSGKNNKGIKIPGIFLTKEEFEFNGYQRFLWRQLFQQRYVGV